MSKQPSDDGHEPATEEMNRVADQMAVAVRHLKDKPIADRLEEQRRRVFELGAIVKVVSETLNGFSGDEPALDIVSALSTHCFALDGAYRLSNEVNEQLELIGREFEEPPAAPRPPTEFPFNHEARAALDKVWEIKDQIAADADSISTSSVGAPNSAERLKEAYVHLERAAHWLETVANDPAEEQRWRDWGDIYDNAKGRPELYGKTPY